MDIYLISFDPMDLLSEMKRKKLNIKIFESEPRKEDYVDGIRMYILEGGKYYNIGRKL